jgi:hypothetical protein
MCFVLDNGDSVYHYSTILHLEMIISQKLALCLSLLSVVIYAIVLDLY